MAEPKDNKKTNAEITAEIKAKIAKIEDNIAAAESKIKALKLKKLALYEKLEKVKK